MSQGNQPESRTERLARAHARLLQALTRLAVARHVTAGNEEPPAPTTHAATEGAGVGVRPDQTGRREEPAQSNSGVIVGVRRVFTK